MIPPKILENLPKNLDPSALTRWWLSLKHECLVLPYGYLGTPPTGNPELLALVIAFRPDPIELFGTESVASHRTGLRAPSRFQHAAIQGWMESHGWEHIYDGCELRPWVKEILHAC